MVSKKTGGDTVNPAGEEQQGKAVVKNAKMSKKKKIEVEERKSGFKPCDTKVVQKYYESEIDEIFGNKKRKVAVAEPSDDALGAVATKTKKKRKKKKEVKGADAEVSVQKSSEKSAYATGAKRRKKTIDGFTIYSEDEIGWNKKVAGGTPLCPFDCDCCF